ncbi:hypothetical protein T05_7482 [Trichinella murrelli]|uniref:MAM domain-containing protein n=1 Tax=Trichinella murrelli TaxID=144512 RepID=A0A0V0TXH2_9BILA|nr:hypothetical protein T05_7482 [Trichinella murrelli]
MIGRIATFMLLLMEADLIFISLMVVKSIVEKYDCCALITSPEQLDCSFEATEACLWFNGTNGVEDSIDWSLAEALSLPSDSEFPLFLSSSNNNNVKCLNEDLTKDNIPQKMSFTTLDCDKTKLVTLMVTSKKTGTDKYVYVSAQSRNATAWIVSDEITAQSKAGYLSFSYWKNQATFSIKVCSRSPPGFPNKLNCSWPLLSSRNHKNQWIREKITIPTSKNSKSTNDLFALDDIQYRTVENKADSHGNYVKASNREEPVALAISEKFIFKQNKPKLEDTNSSNSIHFDSLPDKNFVSKRNDFTEPEIFNGKENAHEKKLATSTKSCILEQSKAYSMPMKIFIYTEHCPQVACDFDMNICQYQNMGPMLWKQTKSSIGNPLISIGSDFNGDGGFLYAASIHNSEETFTLASNSFVTDVPGILSFNYYIPGKIGKLQVCDNIYCTIVFNKLNLTTVSETVQWNFEEMKILPGVHQLFFIASHLPPHHILAIDNIQLWNENKDEELICDSLASN